MHSTRPYTRKFAFLPSPVTNRASIDDFALRQGFLLPMTIRNMMTIRNKNAPSQLNPGKHTDSRHCWKPREFASSRMTRLSKTNHSEIL